MKTFILTQQEINDLYCPLRTKPKNITTEQWNEAKIQYSFKIVKARDEFNFNPWPQEQNKVSSYETQKPITT